MKKKAISLIAGLLLSIAASASATTIGFEELTPPGYNPGVSGDTSPIYFTSSQGFDFAGVAPLQPVGQNFGATTKYGMVGATGTPVGTNGNMSLYTRGGYSFEMTRTDHFSFVDALFTAAFAPTETGISVTGYRDGSSVYTDTFDITNSAQLLRTFNWYDVDRIVFTPGTPSGDERAHMVVDDIQVSPVPEPSSLILVGAGLVGAFIIRRKRSLK